MRRDKSLDFDIKLADVIVEYNLTKDQLSDLGVLTMNKGIACKQTRNETLYRRSTIERMYGHQKNNG